MKSPFRRTGFDSIISKNTTLTGTLIIGQNETILLDGKFTGIGVTQEGDLNPNETALVVGGSVKAETVTVSNVTIAGSLECDLLIVEGLLAIQINAMVKAREIRYRMLSIQDGAIVLAQMNHLDHISSGEQV